MKKVYSINIDQSRRISNMSFFCACMIVFFHATPAPAVGSMTWWICHLLGREGVCKIAVPWFFCLSGFLLSGHVYERRWWQHELSKRVRSLVIPFYVWTVVTIVWGALISYIKTCVLKCNSDTGMWDMPICEFFLFFVGLHPYRDIGPLWYVRCLFFLVIISPFIIACNKRWKIIIAGLFFVHCLFSCLFNYGFGLGFYFLFDRFLSVRGLFYFVLGVFLRLNCSLGFDAAVPRTEKMKGFVLFLGLGLLILEAYLRLIGRTMGASIIEVITIPILLSGTFAVLPCKELPIWMLRNAFPIFLMHCIFLSIAAFFFIAINIYGKDSCELLLMFSRTIISISASIFVAEILRKFFPRFAKCIFGGR